MKKICYVTTIAATIRSFFVPQLKYLSAHGFDVTVICAPEEDDVQALLGPGIRYIPMGIPRGINLIQSIAAIWKLFRVFRKETFDMVQYSTPNAALYAAIASKYSNVKIRNYHLMGFRYTGFSGLKAILFRYFEKLTCRLSTHIECVSKSNLAFGEQQHIYPAGKATVIWNGSSGGVDLQRFCFDRRDAWRNEIRGRLGFKDDDFVFGFIGRITADKGIHEILEAFGEIEGCRLLLLGDIENRKTLEEKLLHDAQNDARIVFCPSVNDVEKYYAAIDVLLLPSYREGFGMVIAEAGAMGTPAIVSDIPGPVDVVVKNRTALVVPAKNTAALKSAMEQLRTNPSMVEHMSVLAHAIIVSQFDSDVLCTKIYDRKMTLLQTAD